MTGEVITRVYALVSENQMCRIMFHVETQNDADRWQKRLDELAARPQDAWTDSDKIEAESLEALLRAWMDIQQ